MRLIGRVLSHTYSYNTPHAKADKQIDAEGARARRDDNGFPLGSEFLRFYDRGGGGARGAQNLSELIFTRARYFPKDIIVAG